jgi:hypothetical protein
MARVKTFKNSCAKRVRTLKESRSLRLKKDSAISDFSSFKGSSRTGVVAITFFAITFLLLSGFFYLFQVNKLATKGFEIKEMENKIKDLGETGKKLQIKETELRSMYAIERDARSLNLISSSNVSYVEINGPMAMK